MKNNFKHVISVVLSVMMVALCMTSVGAVTVRKSLGISGGNGYSVESVSWTPPKEFPQYRASVTDSINAAEFVFDEFESAKAIAAMESAKMSKSTTFTGDSYEMNRYIHENGYVVERIFVTAPEVLLYNTELYNSFLRRMTANEALKPAEEHYKVYNSQTGAVVIDIRLYVIFLYDSISAYPWLTNCTIDTNLWEGQFQHSITGLTPVVSGFYPYSCVSVSPVLTVQTSGTSTIYGYMHIDCDQYGVVSSAAY